MDIMKILSILSYVFMGYALGQYVENYNTLRNLKKEEKEMKKHKKEAMLKHAKELNTMCTNRFRKMCEEIIEETNDDGKEI